jgi:TipAS antibiotic-recognition protein
MEQESPYVYPIGELVKTVDKTIKKIDREIIMEDKELYGGFTEEKTDRYAEEVQQRWGHTEAFKQSQIRVKKMGKEGLNRVMKEGREHMNEIVSLMDCDQESERVQSLIARHYDGLRAFYEPNLELYRGLADLYVTDERFKAFFENIAVGLAQFVHDAMLHYVDVHEAEEGAVPGDCG